MIMWIFLNEDDDNSVHSDENPDLVLLCGLWAATEKPDLNLFLCECLPPNHEKPVTIKVHTLLAPVDSVERCALQNIHQYNVYAINVFNGEKIDSEKFKKADEESIKLFVEKLELLYGKEYMNQEGKSLYLKMMGNYRNKMGENDNNLVIFGNVKNV
ncbi:hypothetical protein TSAR_006908 [Trichomalopsis sarcophagae]|uniref:Uncharacterized protein n=1 Tax=Trichomalopsis sarcophagae TaxID=543379 RepID=A0A232EFH5_9HYME|nr:hypothetical protein TSAR_006908 [Trichomalopsis sarcophagae]